MKKLVVFVMLLCASIAGRAQQSEYSPLAVDGKMWTMWYKLVVPPEYGNVVEYGQFKAEGDTIIDGIQFKWIWEVYKDKDTNQQKWSRTSYLIGDDEGKVWLSRILRGESKKALIMDFTMKEGDRLPSTDMSYPYQVVAVSDTILSTSTDGKRRKVVYVRMTGKNTWIEGYGNISTDEWIEGIGSTKYGFMGGYGALMLGSSKRLEKCELGGVILFEYGNSTGIMLPRNRARDATGTLHDLHGRRLTSKPEKGVYIEGGRKRVAGK